MQHFLSIIPKMTAGRPQRTRRFGAAVTRPLMKATRTALMAREQVEGLSQDYLL